LLNPPKQDKLCLFVYYSLLIVSIDTIKFKRCWNLTNLVSQFDDNEQCQIGFQCQFRIWKHCVIWTVKIWLFEKLNYLSWCDTKMLNWKKLRFAQLNKFFNLSISTDFEKKKELDWKSQFITKTQVLKHSLLQIKRDWGRVWTQGNFQLIRRCFWSCLGIQDTPLRTS